MSANKTSSPVADEATQAIADAVEARVAAKAYQKQTDELKKTVDELTQRKADLEIGIKNLESTIEQKSKEFNLLESAHDAKLAKVKEIIQSTEADISARRAEVEGKEKAMSKREADAKVKEEETGSLANSIQEREIKVTKGEAELENKNEEFNANVELLKKRIAEATDEKEKFRITNEGMEEQKTEAAVLLKDAETVMDQANARKLEVDTESEQLRKDTDAYQREYARLRTERAAFEPQYLALQELQTWIIAQQNDREDGAVFSKEISDQLAKIAVQYIPEDAPILDMRPDAPAVEDAEIPKKKGKSKEDAPAV